MTYRIVLDSWFLLCDHHLWWRQRRRELLQREVLDYSLPPRPVKQELCQCWNLPLCIQNSCQIMKQLPHAQSIKGLAWLTQRCLLRNSPHERTFLGLFLQSSSNFRPGKLFYVCCVWIQDQRFNNFKIIQWNYKSTKQNWLVCGLGTVLLFNRLDFKICLLTRKN